MGVGPEVGLGVVHWRGRACRRTMEATLRTWLDLAVFAPYELVKCFGSIKLHTMSLVTGMYA